MKPATPLFDNGAPTEPLLTLLKRTDVTHAGNLQSIRDATQQGWRQRGKHSGDIPDRFPELRDEAIVLFEELGFIGEQPPQLCFYDYALVFGAYILAVRKRLAMLKQLWWEGGLRFGHLVLLGGKRPAHSEKESLAKINAPEGGLIMRPGWEPLTAVPPTEDEIMRTVLVESDLPAEWKDPRGHTVVDTPLRSDRPEKPDPSAEDTLLWWLGKSPCGISGSRILGVYSQPGVRHIEAVCQRILGGYSCTMDCVGYAALGSTLNVSQTLDTMAKVIFELALTEGV